MNLQELRELAEKAYGPSQFTDEGVVSPFKEFAAAFKPDIAVALISVAEAAIPANDHFPDDKLDTALTKLAEALK